MSDSFEEQIQALQRKLQTLSEKVEAGEDPEAVVQASISQVSNALEELHVAEEELRAQNDELRTMRAELEAAKERYQALFNFAPGGYLVTDREAVIREANQAAAKLLNIAQKHLAGKPLAVYVPEADRPAYYAHLSRARAGEAVSLSPFQIRLQPRDGDAFHASITIARGKDEERESLRWLIRDVTDRKKAEEALRKSEARYRALFENNHAPMLLIDPETGDIVDANPAASAYYGYDRDEFRERSVWQINQRSKEEVLAEMRRAREEKRRHFHFRHRLANGEVRDVEVYSGPIEIGGRQLLYSIIHDITPRVEARRALQQRETRLKILNAIATDLIERRPMDEIVEHTIEQLAAALPEVRPAYCTIDSLGELCVQHATEHREMPSRVNLKANVGAALEYFKKLQWGLPVVSADVSADERLISLADFHADGGSRATLDVPIKQWDELTGILCFDAPRPHEWSEFEIDLLTNVAQQLSTAFRQTYIEQERRRVEQALVESERLLKAAQQLGRIGHWVYDVQADDISWSDTMYALYERTPREGSPAGLQDNLNTLYPPEAAARLAAAVQRAIEEAEPYEIDLEVNLPSGRTAYHHAIGTPITDENGQVVELRGTAQDITERKKTELALRRHQERLEALHRADRAILEASAPREIADAVLPYLHEIKSDAQIAITTFDFEAGQMEVLAAHVHDPASQIKQGITVDLEDVWFLNKLQTGARYTEESLSSVTVDSPLKRGLQKAGITSFTVFPLIAQHTLLGALSVAFPGAKALSTELLKAFGAVSTQLAIGLQQARLRNALRTYNEELQEMVEQRTASLRATEARFRATFEGAAVGIAQLTADGKIIEANRALARLLGHAKSQLAGEQFTEFLHTNDVDKAVDHYRALLAGERQYYRHDLRMQRADGEVLDTQITISALEETDDHPQFAIAMVEDVTEQKIAQAELIQAEKLAITGRLAASLAHEINNPLQTVIGALGLAQEALDEDGDADRYLDISMQELERAARIVADLRNLNRPARLEERALVKINALLKSVLTLTQKRCENRGINVVWEPATSDPLVFVVRDRMQQVFLNLVLNAIEAMPDGGRLTVSAAHTETPEKVRVRISDTGVGIAPEARDRLFDAFYTTKSDGVGLGLYVTHGIIRDHGGHIDVESCMGEGTTFTVWLPDSPED